MWKRFIYTDKVRTAWVPEEGPCYQVTESGELKTGFRAFNREKMTTVTEGINSFDLIDRDDLEDYPELRAASEPKLLITVEEACFLLECGLYDSPITDRITEFADEYCGERT
jgi:hypothetical protein